MIETVGLTRAYDGVRAVDDLKLEVPKGSVYGFLGRNGAGKTTTVKMLSTVLHPTRWADSMSRVRRSRSARLLV